MPQYTIPIAGGGAVTVNASDPAAAIDNAKAQGIVPAGDTGSVIAGGHMMGGPGHPNGPAGPTGPGPSPTSTNPGGVTKQDLDAQFQKMLAAMASANAEDFAFEKEKFNRMFEQQQLEFQEQTRQFEKQFGLQEGSLTGMYGGNPTLAAQLQQAQLSGIYNGQPTEQARQFNQRLNADVGTSLLNAATQIRGPRDYLQYQQFTRGGQNLIDQLQGNQSIPGFGAPTGQMENATLASVMQDLGLMPQGAGGPMAMANDRGQLPGPPTDFSGVQPFQPGGGARRTGPVEMPIGTNTQIGTPRPGTTPTTIPEQRMYGQYSLDAVANAIAAQGGDVATFWRLMNDTANPSSLNWALYSATGGKVTDIGQLGAGMTAQAPAVAQPQQRGFLGATPDVVAPGGPPAPSPYHPQEVNPYMQQWQRGLPGGVRDTGTGDMPNFIQPPDFVGGQSNIDPGFGANSRMAGMAAPPADPRSALLSRFGLSAGQQLLPHQINPARWDAMGQIGRDLTKNLAETQFGYDAEDFERQINATRPLGTVGRRTSYSYGRPTGLY